MTGVLIFVGSAAVGLGIGFAVALWLVSRFDSILSVTYRRDRK